MPRVVTVVSKKGCHLCERVIETLASLASRYDLDVRVVDIANDAKLVNKYFLTIPVVQIDGRDVFDGRQMTLDSSYVSVLEQALSN